MKKRFISLLLTVLMVLSLFSGLSVNAYAATTAYGANTIEYTTLSRSSTTFMTGSGTH